MNSALSETPVNLTGQVALVTGGGRGLGRAFALALAGAGAQVAVTARTAAQLAETVQLIERAGGCALAIPGDVSVPDAVAHVVTITEQQLGPVDLLVNNAGFHVPASLGYDWEVAPPAFPSRPSRGLPPRAPLRRYPPPSCDASPAPAKGAVRRAPPCCGPLQRGCRSALGAPQSAVAGGGGTGEGAAGGAAPKGRLFCLSVSVSRASCVNKISTYGIKYTSSKMCSLSSHRGFL